MDDPYLSGVVAGGALGALLVFSVAVAVWWSRRACEARMRRADAASYLAWRESVDRVSREGRLPDAHRVVIREGAITAKHLRADVMPKLEPRLYQRPPDPPPLRPKRPSGTGAPPPPPARHEVRVGTIDEGGSLFPLADLAPAGPLSDPTSSPPEWVGGGGDFAGGGASGGWDAPASDPGSSDSGSSGGTDPWGARADGCWCIPAPDEVPRFAPDPTTRDL